MAEIEFSVLSRACLKGRNPDADALQRQIMAYETQRNAAGDTINWRFSTHDARTKLHRLYPCYSKIDEYWKHRHSRQFQRKIDNARNL